jgi:flagellar motor switch protein FliN/FliY
MPGAADVQSILKLRVPVIVRIADRQLSLGEVVHLAPGSLVELPRSADQPLDLMVNNKLIGRGTAVKVGEKFGLKVQMIGDAAERIRAMGPDESESAAPADPDAADAAEKPAAGSS